MIFAISFLSGTALALSLGSYSLPSFAKHGLVGFVTSTLLFILMKDKTKFAETGLIFVMGISLSLVTCNNYLTKNYFPSIAIAGNTEDVVIRIDESLRKSKNNRYNYIVTVIGSDNNQVLGGIKARVSFDEPWEIGDVFLCPIKFGLPRNSTYFNYERYLASTGIFLTGSVDEENITQIDHASYISIINQMRQKSRDSISKYIPDLQASLAVSLTTGDSSLIASELYSIFADSGLTHIISASSSIVTFLSAGAVSLFRKMGIGIKTSSLLGILTVFAIVLILGFDPSITRSAIIGIVYFVGKIIDRPSDILTSLSFAAILSAWWNPFILFSLAFVFSYVSFLCLITIVPEILDRCREKFASIYENKVTKLFFETFVTSAIINLALTPINIYYFRRISLYAPFANVFVVVLVSFIIFLGVVLIVLGFFPFLGFIMSIVASLTEICVNLFINIARMFTKLPFASVYIWGAYAAICIGLVAAIILILELLRRKNIALYNGINKAAYFLCIVICVAGYSVNWYRTMDDVYISAVNVSRSNSFALFGRTDSVIVLSKANYNDATAILGYLDNNGVDKVTALVVLDDGNCIVENTVNILDDIKVDSVIALPGLIEGREVIPLEDGVVEVGSDIYIEVMDGSLYVNFENISVSLIGETDVFYPADYGMYIGESKRDFVPDVQYVIGYHSHNYEITEIAADQFDDLFIRAKHMGEKFLDGKSKGGAVSN